MTPPPVLIQALADRYTIERELGQGGMATVYLAEDVKHQRKVAVKVLRPELAATLGPERFAREIAVAARLQHPHILGLLDSGDADGFFYYVMPYVEGETLRDRLARAGELPVPDAVRLLSEIAEALAVAHRGGVVHRDIKPENILLSGRHALVMDFGVAKAVTEASGRQQLTTAGIALGTPAYMAPEQAAADPQMDGRVDIYALGVLGYEMLTGHTPFPGLSPQQTLVAHVTQVPAPVGQQRAGLSPALEAVIMRCLAKRPADRFQSADELAALLEPLATPSGGMTPTHTQPVQATAGPHRRLAFGVGAAVILTVVVIAALAVSLTRARRPVAIADQRQFTFTGDVRRASISPDAKWLAYSSGDTALLVQEVAGGRAVPVLRARAFRQPVWSPDGGSLLVGVNLNGDLVVSRGPSSSRIVAVTVPPSGNAAGSEALSLSSGTGTVGPPAVSPDGRWVAWPEQAGPTVSVLLAPFAGGTPRTIARYEGAWHRSDLLHWAPDSRRLAYFVGDSSPYDLYTATTDGAPPVRVTAMTGGGADWGMNWTWARQGLIVPDRLTYRLVDPGSGRASPLAPFDSLEIPDTPLLSPDGRTLIAVRGRPNGFASEIWQRRLGAGAWKQVPSTFTGEPSLLGWDDSGIYAAIYPMDGSRRVEIWRATSLDAPFMPLLTGLGWCTGSPPSLSDDNRHLAYRETTITSDIWLISGFDPAAR